MAGFDSFLMDSLSDSLLLAATEAVQTGTISAPAIADKPLSALCLPSSIVSCYQRVGITHLFTWQAECLLKASSGKRNFIFSAPASAGKTIVSELLLIKSILENKRKALFIEPYVSIVQEKANYFRKLFSSLHLRVVSFAGGTESIHSFVRSNLIVCTIEKANSLINRLLSQRNGLNELGIIVVDELHWVGEPNRGYLLELLLSKINYSNRCQATPEPIQIIGMSATIPNLEQIARWLDADSYETNFRPIPLIEYVKIDSTLYNRQFVPMRNLNFSEHWNQGDNEGVTELIWNVLEQPNQSVLVFCSTKHWCEVLAKLLAKNFRRITDEKQIYPFDKHRLNDVIEQLRRTPAGLDADLALAIPMGVAFHHAGLTFDERDIIENAYRTNVIRVIVCTTTLSSGVNLPARLVIIRSPIQNGRCIDLSTYLQMVGRAGRKGFDNYAESILICSRKEVELVQKMFEQQQAKPIESCFLDTEASISLKRALLEIVTSGKANDRREISYYIESTFFYQCSTSNFDQEKLITKCLNWLCDNELIRSSDKENIDLADGIRYEATPLGLAVISSAIHPDDGIKLVIELSKAQRNICVENDLHLIYLIIPQHLINTILTTLDWNVYHTVWPTGAVEQHVAHLVGVNSIVVYKKAASLRIEKREFEEKLDAGRYARFFIALILNDLLAEKSMLDVMKKYQCTKNFVQQLQQATATFTSIVQIFAERLSWTNLKQLLNHFQSRLQFGVKQELCELIRIPLLNACRARQLYNDGFSTLALLANGDPHDIERSLQKAVPFQTGAQQMLDEQYGQLRRDQYCIFVPGQSPLTNRQAAQRIVEEAKSLLQQDLQSMGFGIVTRKDEPIISGEQLSDSETDSNDEDDDCDTRESSIINCPPSKLTLPSLIEDTNLRVRNAYVDGKHICSEFILMVEHKETMAISCLTRKITKPFSNQNAFQINHQQEMRIEFIACAFSIHKIYLINVAEDEQYFQQHRMSALIHIREKLMNRKHNIIVYNALETLFILLSYFGMPRLFARTIDLQLCTWLKQDSLTDSQIATWIEMHEPVLNFDESLDKYKTDENEEESPHRSIAAEVLLYASIVPIIEQQMNQKNLWNYYINVEMPALNVILQMLLNGILVDQDELVQNREILTHCLSQLELQAYRFIKRRFKLNRQKDLIKVLYEQLKLPIQRTPHGRICLKKSYLNVLADQHPLAKLITEYRQVQNALDRCIDPLEQFINEPSKPISLQRLRREASWQNERLYTRCHFLTASGRMMIFNPPLQHVPKRFQIESLSNPVIVKLRKIIIPRPGFQLVSFDYSQLELRILAHLSDDQALKHRLIESDDFFKSLAADLLNRCENEITSQQRQNAKQVCYGILYGMSIDTLARETRMSLDQAQEFLDRFYQKFPTMTAYLDQIKERLHETGHLQSLLGRSLEFDLNRLKSRESIKRQMERQAINFVVQASACDLMKVTMDRIHQILERMFPFDLKTRPTPIRPVYLLLQLHDELIFEIEMNSRSMELIQMIRQEMERQDLLQIPLPVRIQSGHDWDSMSPVIV